MNCLIRNKGLVRPEFFVAQAIAAVVLFSLCLAAILFLFRAPSVDNSPIPGVSATGEVSDSLSSSSSAKNLNEASEQDFQQRRLEMVATQIAARGVNDDRVLEAMRNVPRHHFVPQRLQNQAYRDFPLPIGYAQTISQPLIVAMMTQLAQPTAQSRALDVGTGSGYQAAILAELVDKVYSIEILEPLARDARQRLQSLGYDNVEVRCGDGYRGWSEQAPFDVIIVAAAPDHVPQSLMDQLAPGGHLVIPVGQSQQDLLVIEKQADGTIQRRSVTPVAFVPMTGEAQQE